MTGISAPVVFPLAGEARKTTSRATSSSVDSRRVGVWAAIAASAGGGMLVRWLGVGTSPGMTTLTRIPAGPALCVRLRARPCTAALAAPYDSGLDPRNAVSILDALQERELLQRQPDPRDRRRHAVKLTPAGARMMAQLAKEGDRLEHAMLDCLSQSERAELHRLLLAVFRSIRDD